MLSGEQNPGPAADGTRQRRWPRPNLLLLGVACVIPVFYLAYVWHYGVNFVLGGRMLLIRAPDWMRRRRSLTLSLLWAQYNENRLVHPQPALGTVRSDHPRKRQVDDAVRRLPLRCQLRLPPRYLSVGRRQMAGSSANHRCGTRMVQPGRLGKRVLKVQIVWYLIIFFLMAMLLVLSRRQITPGALVFAMALAVAASISSLQGLFVWPVGLLCLLWRLEERSRKVSYSVAWMIVGVVTTVFYFWHYTFQGTAGVGVGYDLRNVDLVVEYLLAAVGNVIPFGTTSVALHALIGIPLCLAAVLVSFRSFRERVRAPGPHPLPLSSALIVFALLFDVSIAVERLNLGVDGALASRYTMANLLIIVGICLFVFQRVPTWQEITRPSASPLRTLGIVAVALLVVVQIASSAHYGFDNARVTQGQGLKVRG